MDIYIARLPWGYTDKSLLEYTQKSLKKDLDDEKNSFKKKNLPFCLKSVFSRGVCKLNLHLHIDISENRRILEICTFDLYLKSAQQSIENH